MTATAAFRPTAVASTARYRLSIETTLYTSADGHRAESVELVATDRRTGDRWVYCGRAACSTRAEAMDLMAWMFDWEMNAGGRLDPAGKPACWVAETVALESVAAVAQPVAQPEAAVAVVQPVAVARPVKAVPPASPARNDLDARWAAILAELDEAVRAVAQPNGTATGTGTVVHGDAPRNARPRGRRVDAAKARRARAAAGA